MSDLAAELETSIESGHFDEEQLSFACRLLLDLHQLETAANERRLLALATIIERIHDLAGLVRTAESVESVLYDPFKPFCAAAGFRRALVSSVGDDRWRAESLYVAPDLEPGHLSLKRFLEHKVIPLKEARLEGEVVRRRTPLLVKAPLSHKLTYKPLMRASDSHGYVVAPLVARSKVVGLLHLDRFDEGVTPNDLLDLTLLAKVLGFAVDDVVQRRRLASFASRVNAMASSSENLHLAGASRPAAPLPRVVESGPPLTGVAATRNLTRREHQVFRLVATGARNSDIARELGIAEATVKTHVTSILDKLGVKSRAAAVAVRRGATEPTVVS